MPDARFDSVVGRYVYLTLADGLEYRVYFEESGTGRTLLLLQHTAGADARQWRYVLEDPELQASFRIVAYDLPYHGKSVPPSGKNWWQEEYQLSRSFLMSTPLKLAEALGEDRPVFMGSSIGGHLAIDLAVYHPEKFRSVVALETAARSPGGFIDEFNHPRVSNDYKASIMYGMMAPTSPDSHRHETRWVYSQGAPAVFKGDLYYYSVDHDVRNTAAGINTDLCKVFILNGEFDWSGTPQLGKELAEMIPGAHYQTMKALGHFPMSENPEAFLNVIRPVLAQANAD